MKYIDTHAHYNDEKFNDILDETLEDVVNAEVTHIINIGYDKKSSIKAIELSRKYEYMYTTVGVHPHDVRNDSAQDIYDIYNKSNSEEIKKIVGIGEIGLDYAFIKDNKDEQAKLFIEQIELSNALKLPIVIHTRDASLDTYKIIKEHKAKYGTLFHCFSPTDDLMRLVLEGGYSVAFGGNITYKRNASFEKYIVKIPIGQIVIETDSPYLPPEPYRGKINTSANLPIICKRLSEYKNMNEEEVAKLVYSNSIKFFNINEKD
ncbi:MAG: TatD family hydrolase [Clostridia bacterium]